MNNHAPAPAQISRGLVFEGKTWQAYETLRQKQKSTHKKLCEVIKSMLRTPDDGVGKPKPLKHYMLQGEFIPEIWSRRISGKDRVVYKFDARYVYVFGIDGHYGEH